MIKLKKYLLNLLLIAIVLVSSLLPNNTSFALTSPTLIFHSGWETGSLIEWTNITGTPTASTTQKRTGSYSMLVDTTGGAASCYVYNSVAASRISFYFYIDTSPGAEVLTISRTYNGSRALYIGLGTDNYLYSYTTKGSAPLSAGWNRISSSIAGTGSSKVYVNGVEDAALANKDIAAGGNSEYDIGLRGITTAKYYYDDVAVDNTASTADLGDLRSVLALPNAAGDVANFDTVAGSATHYLNVNDVPASQSDLTYNEQAGSNQVYDHYNIQDSSTLGISNVVAVNIFARMTTSAATTGLAGISVRQGSTNYDTKFNMTTTKTWFSKYYAAQPATGAWTDATFDSFQVGAISTGTTRDTFIYEEWVIVVYAVIPGNPSGLASPSQTSVSIDLTWTKGTQADQTLIRYRSDGTYPTSTSDGTQGYLGTASSTTVGSLSPSTTYKFRAWAYSSPLDLYSSGTSDLTQATPAGYDISNSPTSKDFGVVATSATLYAKGSAPSNPVVDGDCTFTITNNGSGAVKINIKATDFTGGVGWTLGAPGANTARMTAYYSGENPASGVVLTTSDQQFYASLAASGTLKWDFKLETPTSTTDGAQKSSTITLTATAP